MIRIALTGSIGMGKSTVAGMFEKAGIPVFDADYEVRQLQAAGGLLVDIIGQRFPGTVRDGVIDRDALSQIVIADPRELAALEAIVHPHVRELRARFIEQNSDRQALLFDIPLLFETGSEREFDTVVVVSAPAQIQRKRVLRRPGMTEEKLAGILGRQLPDEQKRAKADFVIDTSGDLASTERQVAEILACLGLSGGG